MDDFYVSSKERSVKREELVEIVCFQSICNATVRGCVDSIKGIAVVFYLDREVNKKLSSRSSRSQSTSNERLNQTGTPSTVRRSGINKEATKREE